MACLSLALLPAPTNAQAGTYTVTYGGGTGYPTWRPPPVLYENVTFTTAGNVYSGIASDPGGNALTAAVSGSPITATFTWSDPGNAADPPPQSVIITQTCTASASGDGYVSPAKPPTGSCNDGLGQSSSTMSMSNEAAIDLHAGKYAQAELKARLSLSINNDLRAEKILPAALEAQGKDQEAFQFYRVMVENKKCAFPRILLPYAQLLLKSGQWAQAVAVYNQALPSLGNEELEEETSHFSPDVPQPLALETAIHLERGQIYNGAPSWERESQNTEAMAEYEKALQLAPDNALTNYFYGVGWQKLTPTERAKFGTAQQAKAHLQKAEKRAKLL